MLKLYEAELRSRLLLGTSRFPSPAVLVEAVKASRADVVTVSLRRESSKLFMGQDTSAGYSSACFSRRMAATYTQRWLINDPGEQS